MYNFRLRSLLLVVIVVMVLLLRWSGIVCCRVGWAVAGAYTEPSPNLCAPLLARVRSQQFDVFSRTADLSELHLLKSLIRCSLLSACRTCFDADYSLRYEHLPTTRNVWEVIYRALGPIIGSGDDIWRNLECGGLAVAVAPPY